MINEVDLVDSAINKAIAFEKAIKFEIFKELPDPEITAQEKGEGVIALVESYLEHYSEYILFRNSTTGKYYWLEMCPDICMPDKDNDHYIE